MSLNIQPVTLTWRVVRLVPLNLCHVPDLVEVAGDESIWEYMRFGLTNDEPKLRSLVEYMLNMQARGTDLPFSVIHRDSEKAVGMTRFLNIDRENRSVEIGGTWYGVAYQRTAVNTECKYLLLRHAFEEMGAIRVQMKTDVRNERSQKAIERLGAVREGLLRDHMILPDGTVRSSIFYSILEREWPEVKRRLEERMELG